MALTQEEFIKKWEQEDDKGRLTLLENNLQLKMVVLLGENETKVTCTKDKQVSLSFEYCQGNCFMVKENLSKLHIKHQNVA